MSDSLHDFLEKLESIIPFYEGIRDFAGDYSAHLAQEFKSSSEKAREMENTERTLRIGIVGQTKVGKSSLLNALYFGGREILPKASTPMTASLTLINYSDRPKAEITFYDSDDWKCFEAIAESGRARLKAEQEKADNNRSLFQTISGGQVKMPSLSQEEQGAIEVIQKAPADYRELLGTSKEINADSIDGFIGILSQYAGSSGKYTSLVKKIELSVPVEALKGVALVDTPGLNDPIVSRSQVTRRYLGRCDAILVLSYSGSFLDATDMDLVIRQLPDEGIARTRLVATKFDSALIQDGYGASDIKKAVSSVRSTIASVVRKKIEELKKAAAGGIEKYNEAAMNMEKASPAIPVSVMAHQIALNYGSLNGEESHILNNLNSLVKGFRFDREMLESMSGLEDVRKFISDVIADKEPIILQRMNEQLPKARERIAELLDGLLSQSENSLHELKNNDVESLKKRLSSLLSGIDLMQAGLASVFDRITGRLLDAKNEIIANSRDAKANIRRIEEHVRTWEESYQVKKKGIGGGVKRFLGGLFGKDWGYETRYETKTEQYLAVDEAVDGISAYVDICISMAEKQLNSLGNRGEITKQLKNAMIDGIDFNDVDFDQKRRQLLAALDRVVNDIVFPDINLSSESFEKIVTQQFSDNRVTGADMARLKEAQRNAFNSVIDAMDKELARKTGIFRSSISAIRDDFVSRLKKELSQGTEKLQSQLKDREASIEKYSRIITQITKDRVLLLG